MSLIDQMREDRRADIKSLRARTLAVVIGDAERISKNPTDAETMNAIRSSLKANEAMLSLLTTSDKTDDVAKLKSEAAILKEYLPQQVSEKDLRNFIGQVENPSMGAIMKGIKAQYGDGVDMKMASRIAKEILNG